MKTFTNVSLANLIQFFFLNSEGSCKLQYIFGEAMLHEVYRSQSN